MDSKIEDQDLYELFGIDPQCTEADVKKAYRKKALLCHPDKNPDNPNAAALFHQLSLALQILTDVTARKAYDKVLNGKKAAILRNKELSGKRKKLKEDLELRERLATFKGPAAKSDTEILKAEIERLRKEGAKLLEQENEIIRQSFLNKLNQKVSVWDSTQNRIKITWSAEKSDPNNGGYSKDLLTKYLLKYGDIIGLVMSKKNGRAVVEFTTQEAAEMAVSLEKGVMENPLTLVWMNGKGPVITNAHPGTSSIIQERDFESVVLHKLRQAEERKRLIAEMEAKDKEEEANNIEK